MLERELRDVQERRIGLVVSFDYAFRLPTLIDGVRALAELGYQVDVLAPSDNMMPIHFDTDRVHLYSLEQGDGNKAPKGATRLASRWPDSEASRFRRLRDKMLWVKQLPFLRRVVSLAKHLYTKWRSIQTLVLQLGYPVPYWLRLTRGKHYLCFIGLEPGGLFVATIVGILRGVPVVYHNMELLLSQEIQDGRKLLIKWLERQCNHRAVLTLIQDEARADLLCQDNHIPRSSIEIMPCGVLGPPITERTEYLQRKHGIPASDKIVLYAGKITRWARIGELVQQANQWPNGWVLAIHGFGQYVQEVRNVISRGSGRVILSTELLPQDQLESLLSSGDIGIALYEDLGANFRHTGSASNKLAQYLKCGLPVITNDFPSMRGIVEKYGCGVCVHDESQVIEAAECIMMDYDQYRANALRCFAEHYDLMRYWRAVIGRLEGRNLEFA